MGSDQNSLPRIDPSHRELVEDPYTYYFRLREKGRVHYAEKTGSYWFLGYRECYTILTDKRFAKNLDDGGGGGDGGGGSQDPFEMFSKTMLFADPPAHTRLRSLVNKGFALRRRT